MLSAASQIGKPSSYTPSKNSQMDVSFRPLTQPSGVVQYVALIESEETLRESEYTSECDCNGKCDGTCKSEKALATTPKKPDIFSLGKDPIKTFYIGSVTVLGLFILYRILNKTK
jgi:hypothetical protein